MTTAGDAQRMRFEKASMNHATYKIILGQIQQKIRSHAMMRETSVTVRVPEYVPGRPVYRVHRAARYVTEKLRILGFEASKYGAGTTFFVDVAWKSAAPAPRPPKPPKPPKRRDAPNIVVTSADVSDRLDALRRRLEGVL